MRKFVLSVVTTFIYIQLSFAQFDPQFSQYMNNPVAFNPAAAAESGMIDIAGQHRLNWLGMVNGGQTTTFAVTAPLKFEKSLHGIGLSFLNDKVGAFTNQGVHLIYSFKKRLGEGVLSLGADIGAISVGFNGDSVMSHLVSIGEYFDITSDGAIPTTAVAGTSFDLNIGSWYSTKNIFAGVSLSHLNQPMIEWGTTAEIRPSSTLFITGGYKFDMPGTKYTFTPSTLFKSDFTTSQLDLSAKVDYADKYWGGLSYRWGDAVVFYGGINVTGGLSIGYSYDLPVSKVITASWGSHEFCLKYSFEYVPQKSGSKYKSIRIL